MQRIVKFRVWSKIYDKFLEEPFRIDVTKPIEHLDYIFQQFTGLKDKNGKEIYEGDIVEIYAPVQDIFQNWKVISEVYTYYFVNLIDNDKKVLTYFASPFDGVYKVEIIGNIFENKELLKDKYYD